jgi:outer membrane protein with beta-barrel domain
MKSRRSPMPIALRPITVRAAPPSLVAALALLLAPTRAFADDPPGCPPGEWFCDDAGEPDAPDDGDPDDGYSDDGDADAPPEDAPDDEDEGAPPPGGGWGSMDVRRAAPAPIDESAWSEGSGARLSPWALALRVQGVMLESGSRGGDASLGGAGVSGRYSINPVVALDLGLDSIVGNDYNGYDRSELSLSLSSLFYLNQHPLVRTYVLVGLNVSRASVELGGDDQTWGYFGGQTGLGLEFSLDPHIALNIDAIGFLRGRTDSRAAREPEFTDSNGRVTNTSGGGLLRGGVILHF